MNKKDKKSMLKLDHINSWQNLWIIHGNSCSQKNSKMQSLSCVPMISKAMRWKIFAFKLKNTMFEIVNIQAKLLTTQYIGTCKSAYTKGHALN